MPRWLRIVLTGWCFFLFFFGSPVIPLLVFPWMRLTSRDEETYRGRCTHWLHRGTRFFTRLITFYRLVDAPREVSLPRGVDPSKPYVLVSNHPSLIDVVLSLGWFEGLTCVVKGSLMRSAAFGHLLRSTNYLPGPTGEGEDVCGAIVAHLRKGHPIMVFPEGTRSLADRLHRFRRGAVEAAFEAGVPIVPMYLDVTVPFLMKGAPFWRAPHESPVYRAEFFEVIDPRTETRDARQVNADLQERYRARYAQTVSRRGIEAAQSMVAVHT
ncbi:MAG: 1-acyl-sn-glycerol-3-phosphate acyltransferase [Sandaracinaceae bacterium]|nr:1-acyl-sn-glycerol-3-phosphate acyltransferase [Sandaracinaceae bacterium]